MVQSWSGGGSAALSLADPQVNHETDLFEARLEMLAGLVDVYLVLEVETHFVIVMFRN